MAGALLGLYLTGQSLNIYSQIVFKQLRILLPILKIRLNQYQIVVYNESEPIEIRD